MSRRPYDRVKRLIDVAGAATALLVLSPVMALVAVVVAVSFRGSILFRQQRPGRGRRPFRCLKFQTMRPVDERTGLVGDAERLTAVGRFLRRTSLDELPGLVNVLTGEMSLVGPRPLLMDYLDRYTAEQGRRHEVRPGLTGLAQVSGRNCLSWERRFALDVWYVEHRSLRVDAAILFRTIGVVAGRAGVSAPGHATVPEFQGTIPAGVRRQR